jgi:hypothetical protein
VDAVVNWAKFKQDEQLKRKGGSKRTKVLGITKLDDANYAGTCSRSLFPPSSTATIVAECASLVAS